jgi:hypothetical protein
MTTMVAMTSRMLPSEVGFVSLSFYFCEHFLIEKKMAR